MSNPARFSAAIHEVGHALVARTFGLPVQILRVGQGGDDWAGNAIIGDATHLPLGEQLVVCVAGLQAQELVGCEAFDLGGLGDYGKATTILDEAGVEEQDHWGRLTAAHARARAILEPQVDKLREIATELAQSGQLDEGRLESLLS